MSASFNVNAILGALEVGVLTSTFLFGVATLQAWVYYKRFPDDEKMLKGLVATVWLLTLGQVICDARAVYIMTITDFGQPDKLVKLPPDINVTLFLTSFVALAVQAFYAHRIRVLTGKLYIPIFCWATSGTVAVLSVVAAVQGFLSPNEADYERRAELIIDFAVILTASVDIVITSYLCYYFMSQRSLVQRRTAKLLDRLVAWTIQTGLLTCISTITIVITFQTMKNTFVWVAVSEPLPSLYANSAFALLNARLTFRDALHSVVEAPRGELKVTTIAFESAPSEHVGDTEAVSQLDTVHTVRKSDEVN